MSTDPFRDFIPLLQAWPLFATVMHMQVLQWMEDSGIKPSNGMYSDIFSFAQRSAGAETAFIIYNRIGEQAFDSVASPLTSIDLPPVNIIFHCQGRSISGAQKLYLDSRSVYVEFISSQGNAFPTFVLQ